MNHWMYLKPGDIIDIVATAPGVAISNIEQDLQVICNFIESLGLVARINHQAIFAGSHYFSKEAQAIRQRELDKALVAEDSKAIWFLRGGYGTAKLLPALARLEKPEIPKLIIGYSDLNCLQLWLAKFWDWPSLHARLLYDFIKHQSYPDVATLESIIFGKQDKVIYSHLMPLNQYAKTSQTIYGKITGGTAQVLQSGIGLDWQCDPSDKILFLEEIYDRGVRLDRTLAHFEQLGLFKSVKAILFGDIICGNEVSGEQHCDLAINHFAQNSNVPVLSIANIGHGELNYPLPLNSQAELLLNENSAELVCHTGGKYGN